MDATCKYCTLPENKQDNPGLICQKCNHFVHLVCLRRPGTPGDFACDVFFEYTCAMCSPTHKEVFLRNKFPWVNVILLTLHHLNTHSYGISNNGFFHYKTHICSFIDRTWNLLFGQQTKQKKNWVGTIAGVLSVYNNLVFCSGSMVLGETGWWKLLHGFSPAVGAHIIQELAKERPKGRPRNQLALDKVHFIGKVTEMGYLHLLNMEEECTHPTPVAKKRRLEPHSFSSTNSFSDQFETDHTNDVNELSFEMIPHVEETQSDSDGVYRSFDYISNVPPFHQSDSSSTNSVQQITYYDSDSHSVSSNHQHETQTEIKPRKTVEEIPFVKRESFFSKELNSVDLPWMEANVCKKGLVEMTQYEEIHLLKQVEGLIPKLKDMNKRAYLCRLKAKLTLRRLKRHKHLPVFDLDKAVKVLGGYTSDDIKEKINAERVLDRFQRSYLADNLCGTIASSNYGTMLLPRIEPEPFRSPYSRTLLKPYIRMDYESTPLWLNLRDELLRKTHKHIPGYNPPGRSALQYSYVRPQHMPAINNICAQHFWPGIDLTEALQYPEFSCVVTYKRLIVGCAFLVPDAGHNKAYISFVFTRPEWRRAGIATFMLYHLLQTCSGKDVILHVSPTNPAIFLYQKFGFKVEELIQDFYEKYYDIDYKGCRHALLLRLIR